MSDARAVAPSESASFTGRVWIGDDGRVAAVTKGRAPGPAGFDDAPVVDVGRSLVLPGLIDLHNHLAYNTLPLWAEPDRTTPWQHHNAWPSAASYSASTTWPAYALITACPQELLAYVETQAVVGGTTSIQGSPPKNRPRDGWLVRNIDDETFGTGNANLVYASVLTAKPATLANRANKMRAGAGFVYHCAEGRRGSPVAREYAEARAAGCLQSRFVAVHTNAVAPGDYGDWADAGAIAWSPFSNLWLYGETTDVPAARAAGVAVCLGSDWAPSGSKNVLGELKAARLTADALGWELPDEDLVRMVTCTPGDVLSRAWPARVGRLQPGAQADLVVLRAPRSADPFASVVAATEDKVDLVVVDGVPRYGSSALMSAAGANATSPLRVGHRTMRLALEQPSRPPVPWSFDEVVDRIEQVRAHPRREVEAAQSAYAGWAGRLDHPEAPLRLALDMPSGVAPVGGLPKDLGDLVVPELASLVPDAGWFASIAGRGFHGGVLDDLERFYR